MNGTTLGALARALRLITTLWLPLGLILTNQLAFAGSATWSANPANGDWNNPANWSPNTVPNGPSDTATFAVSSRTAVSIFADVELNGIKFEAGGSPFTIAPSPVSVLTLSGFGITNNSGVTQSFVPANDAAGDWGVISFTNNATAGTDVTFTNNSGVADSSLGGEIDFAGNATAGEATFINNGGLGDHDEGGAIQFFDNSTAADATFISNGGDGELASGAKIYFHDASSAGHGTFFTKGGIGIRSVGAFTEFYDSSTAGDATLTTEGGTFPGETLFLDTASASNATLIAAGTQDQEAGGSIRIYDSSLGGAARIEIFGTGELQTSFHDGQAVTVGSIEGDGEIKLLGGALAVGRNDLSTVFDGIISGSGSLVKVGRGDLVLTNANSYWGRTILRRGGLVANNISGSSTSAGPVRLNAGTLGGKGVIAGEVTIGSGDSNSALLAPGTDGIGHLTIQSTLTFGANAKYNWNLNAETLEADEVAVAGVTIDAGALFFAFGRGNTAMQSGTVFTVIDNTAITPIAGTFGNLPDGSTITIGSNTYRVSYQGGTGNDLTLTVQ